jgi:hypothetical protein
VLPSNARNLPALFESVRESTRSHAVICRSTRGPPGRALKCRFGKERGFARIIQAMPAASRTAADHRFRTRRRAGRGTGSREDRVSSEGDLPAVAQTGAAATGATASTLAFDGTEKQASGDLSHLDRGIHNWEMYKASCEAAGKPEKWKDYYRSGHTEAKGWTQPYEHRQVFDWELQENTSASQAAGSIKGPRRTAPRALPTRADELRDEFGDQFDRLFGSSTRTRMQD